MGKWWMHPKVVEIRRKRAREWQRNNPERAKANAKRFALKNPEKVKEHARRYRMRHNHKNVREFWKRNPGYNTYQVLKQACTNPKNPRYKTYGGKELLLTSAQMKELYLRDRGTLRHPEIFVPDPSLPITKENIRLVEYTENFRRRSSRLNRPFKREF